MAPVDFFSPSYRAAGGDLTVAISPLGLIELSDEEFEVHGPRLNRYAAAWAWYLGHHYAYRRELGEPQVAFNYCRAFSDYLTNFTFGKGFRTEFPRATESVLIPVIQRVWEQDNNKLRVLWDMGQMSSVSGDVFVKVAYEDPWVDGIGRLHTGKIRVLPLNSAFCFPEWHPHDRTRLTRFKLKYRFWGTAAEGTRQVFCVDDKTEALTRRGWKYHDEILNDDEVLGIDPVTKVIQWQPVLSMHRFDYDGDLVHWKNSHGLDALTTPNHRWLTAHRDRGGYSHFDPPGRFRTTEELSGSRSQIITGGGIPQCFASTPVYSDEFVELIGWAVTEGHYQKPPARTGVVIGQSESANPEGVERLRRLVKYFADQGASASEQKSNRSGIHAGSRDFYFGKGIGNLIRQAAPDKVLLPEFLGSLTEHQARLLYETLLDGDGHRAVLRDHDGFNRTVSTETFIQNEGLLVEGFQMLAAMLGRRSKTRSHHAPCTTTTVYSRPLTTARHLRDEREHYQGVVWCPRTPTQTWLARRNGGTFWTGNTYTEILDDQLIREYVNDELVDERPNILGTIPIVHIANAPVSTSPWGLSDIQDIIPLNREFNEKALEISDTINYHAAPVTVLIGAKVGDLEKGPKKIWGIANEKADVKNLELGSASGMSSAMSYIEFIKRSMHEMTGVPETSLGQRQPISNTSGVALAIQYQPLMNKWRLKTTQFKEGIEAINSLIILTLSIKEPQSLIYNPSMGVPLKDDQYPELDPNDPLIYINEVNWPEPMPLDLLIKLNEQDAKMKLGLQSRVGALRELDEEFPDLKIEEIQRELIEDAVRQGTLDMVQGQVQMAVMMETGMPPAEGVQAPTVGAATSAGVGGVGAPVGPNPMENPAILAVQGMLSKMVTDAYGTKIPQRRNPDAEG